MFNESKTEFSTYYYKLANREVETQVLAKYVQKLPKHMQVLSFPYEYAFEENIIRTFGKTMSIWSAEKLSAQDPSETWLNAKRFIRQHPNNEVYLPSTTRGGHIVPLGRYDPKLSLFNILGGETKMAKVDFSRYSVVQQLHEVPNKFDIIDLDYVRSLDIENATWNKMAWSRLGNGGILYTTFGISSYRVHSFITRRYTGDIGEEDTSMYERDIVSKEPENKYIDISANVYKTYGITNEDKYPVYNNVLNNYIDLHKSAFGSVPVYVNVYKGGGKVEGGQHVVMARLVWVKGISMKKPIIASGYPGI